MHTARLLRAASRPFAAFPAVALVLALAAFAAPARAQTAQQQPSTVVAKLEPQNPTVGEEFFYIIEVVGNATPALRPDPADLEGPIRYLGRTEHNTMLSGGRRRVVYRFGMVAESEGPFRIPPATVFFGRQEVRTNEVRGNARPTPQVDKARFGIETGRLRMVGLANPEPLNRQLDGRFFSAIIAPERATVLEPVVLETWVYRMESGPTWVRQPFPAHPRNPDKLGGGAGFVVVPEASAQVQNPFWERVEIDGQAWRRAKVFETTVLPLRPGEMDIAGAAMGVGFTMSSSLRIAQAEFDQPKTRMEVRPLPARPRGAVAQAVGNITASATLDREDLREGDLVTLTVRLSGAAHLQLVDLEDFPDIDGLVFLGEEVDFSVNQTRPQLVTTKVYRRIYQAARPGRHRVPPLGIAVYDTVRGEQVVQETRPLEFEVRASPSGAVAMGPGTAAPARAQARALATDGILFIETDPLTRGAVRAANRRPAGASAAFWSFNAAVLLGALGFAARTTRRRARESDPAAARRDAARTGTDRWLREAHSTIGSSDPEAFHRAAAQGVLNAVAAATGRNPSGLTIEDAAAELRARGADEEFATRLAAFLEKCAAIRYAPAGAAGDRRADLREAEALVEGLRKQASRKPAPRKASAFQEARR